RVCSIVLAVLDRPVPARTGSWPPSSSTAARSRVSYSASNRAAASPVDPATTTAQVPPSRCACSRRRQASRSSSPAAVNGVASAVMLPESRKLGSAGLEFRGPHASARALDLTPVGRRRSRPILLAARKRGQVCWQRVPGPAGHCRRHLLAPDAALTDPDTAARPAPNENYLLINAYT